MRLYEYVGTDCRVLDLFPTYSPIPADLRLDTTVPFFIALNF